VAERVVIDRNRITGGGVTAGIDFDRTMAALLHGEEVAQEIQLIMEYDPQPPFRAGSHRTADAVTVQRVTASRQHIQDQRRRKIERIVRSTARS